MIARDRIEELRAELCRLAELDYADHCATGGDDLEWTEAASPRHDAFAASLGEEYQMLLAMDENWVGLVESSIT
ncbi:hypothetical protein [Paludibaculum fermentans]|uniref:hypothetical protein n=1 Tax=Paludibaculum fermentans TaxID=1473598 RepID=UPI003EBE4DA4